MQRKLTLSIKILAIFIILSNAVILLSPVRAMLQRMENIAHFSLFKSLIISPLGVYQDLVFMPPLYATSFAVIGIILGVFLFLLNNIARKVFIIWQFFIIIFGSIVMLLFFLISQHTWMYWILDTFVRICLFPLCYSVFFRLVAIKKQFNPSQKSLGVTRGMNPALDTRAG
ncbi:MAG: hypothetical protein WC412_06730 [Candidatus Omnitrophota bacterium]|jgi:hypothetical protein